MNRKKLRTIRKIQDAIPTFLSKTYELLQKQENFPIVSWSQTGEQFIVKNINQFTQKILPQYFKHNNYSSFIRQLNMYGFHKIKSDSIIQTFKHQKFKRNNKQLLCQIKRKGTTDLVLKQFKEDNGQLQRIKDSNFSQQIVNMKKKQEQLQKIVDVLVQQNKQILQDNKHLWSKMKKTVQKQQKKIEKVLFLMLLGNGKNFNNNGNNNNNTNNVPQLQKYRTTEKQQSLQKNHNQAILPFQQINHQNALETLYKSLTNKKPKSKYQQELYQINKDDSFKRINDLTKHLTHNKIKIQPHSNMLQIQSQPKKQFIDYQDDLNRQQPDSSIVFSPFLKKLSEQNQYYDDDDMLNKFVLQKSESEFGINPKVQEELYQFQTQK